MNQMMDIRSRRQFILDRMLSATIFVLIAIIGYGVGYLKGTGGAEASDQSRDFDPALVEKTYEYMSGKYVKKLDGFEKNILYGALTGMMDVLHQEPFNDPYSSFFDPQAYTGLSAETKGQYAGIGVRIEIDTDKLLPRVATIFRGSPAASAGIKVDDYILAIDGTPTDGMSLEEVGTRITGKDGTEVSLSISDAVTHIARDVKITRKIVTIHSVEDGRMLAPGLGYVKISSFSENTTVEMKDSLKELTGRGLKNLVIDLRGNGGGTLDNAIDLASMFLPKDALITTLAYRNREELKKVKGNEIHCDAEVILLVDGNTASASEVFAGALRDHGRAILVGQKTFGKGKVQEIVPLSNKKDSLALVLTVAKYFTPNGYDIDANGGIAPDVEFTYDDYKAAIPRLAEIERRMLEMREDIIKYRQELTDRMGEKDIVLENVEKDFDAMLAKGRANREAALAAEKNAKEKGKEGKDAAASAVGDGGKADAPGGGAPGGKLPPEEGANGGGG